MLRRIFVHGAIAGLIVGAFLSGTTIALQGQHPPMPLGMIFGYASMLIALSFVFVGVKRHRDDAQGGVIKFWPAFGMGLAISVVAGLFYVAAWELTLAFTGMDFAGQYAASAVEAAKAKGATAAELAALAARLDAFTTQYANPLYRIPMTFLEIAPVGVLVSVVSAALLRNPRFMPARDRA